MRKERKKICEFFFVCYGKNGSTITTYTFGVEKEDKI
jgi:hypothetical protein